jgi:hypothetical protein
MTIYTSFIDVNGLILSGNKTILNGSQYTDLLYYRKKRCDKRCIQVSTVLPIENGQRKEKASIKMAK